MNSKALLLGFAKLLLDRIEVELSNGPGCDLDSVEAMQDAVDELIEDAMPTRRSRYNSIHSN